MNRNWEPIEGETPIDPSGLKIQGIRTRRELLPYEAEHIRKVVVKYLAAVKAADEFNQGPLTELHRRFWPDA